MIYSIANELPKLTRMIELRFALLVVESSLYVIMPYEQETANFVSYPDSQGVWQGLTSS